MYFHNKNLGGYGYTYPEVIDESKIIVDGKWLADATVKTFLNDYLINAKNVRQDKSVDPRLFVSALQPYADSIPVDSLRPIVKNPGESVAGMGGKHTWSIRKFAPLDRGGFGGDLGPNIYILRLADVYLIYAEALIRSNMELPTALEYINKVKRRACGFPVNSPSSLDYLSLTDKTSASDKKLPS